MIRSVLFLVAAMAMASCTAIKRTVHVPNTYRVIADGRPEIEARVRSHLDRLIFSPEFQARKLEFSGNVVIRTVPAIRRDRLGVPFWSPRERTRDQSGGLTVFTGRARPVVLIIAVLPDGSWDDRTLRHECCHVVLLWNGVSGHPREFARHAPLWR